MTNSKIPYTGVSHFREETQSQLKFLKDIPLNKYRKAIANRFGFKSTKLFEDSLINSNPSVDQFDSIMKNEFSEMCKKSLVSLISDSNYIDEARLRVALSDVYYGKSKDMYAYINSLDDAVYLLELSHIAVSNSDKMSSILMYMIPKDELDFAKSSKGANAPWYKILNYAYFVFLRKHFITIFNDLYVELGSNYLSDESGVLAFDILRGLISSFDFNEEIDDDLRVLNNQIKESFTVKELKEMKLMSCGFFMVDKTGGGKEIKFHCFKNGYQTELKTEDWVNILRGYSTGDKIKTKMVNFYISKNYKDFQLLNNPVGFQVENEAQVVYELYSYEVFEYLSDAEFHLSRAKKEYPKSNWKIKKIYYDTMDEISFIK